MSVLRAYPFYGLQYHTARRMRTPNISKEAHVKRTIMFL